MAFSILDPETRKRKFAIAGGVPPQSNPLTPTSPRSAMPPVRPEVMQGNPLSLKGYDTPRPAGYQPPKPKPNFSRVGNGVVGNPVAAAVRPAANTGMSSAFAGMGGMLPDASKQSPTPSPQPFPGLKQIGKDFVSGVAETGRMVGRAATTAIGNPLVKLWYGDQTPQSASPAPASTAKPAPVVPAEAGTPNAAPPAQRNPLYTRPADPAAAVGPGNTGLEVGQRLRPGIGEQPGTEQPPDMQGAWATDPNTGIITKSVMLGDVDGKDYRVGGGGAPINNPLVRSMQQSLQAQAAGGAREQKLTTEGRAKMGLDAQGFNVTTASGKRNALAQKMASENQAVALSEAQKNRDSAERQNAVTATMGAVGADAAARGKVGVAQVEAGAKSQEAAAKQQADVQAAQTAHINALVQQFGKDGIVTEKVPGFLWDSEKKRIPNAEDIANYEQSLKKQFGLTQGPAQQAGGSGVRMRFPDGKIKLVPADQVQRYSQLGGQQV